MNKFVILLVPMFMASFSNAAAQQKEMPSIERMDMRKMMRDCPMTLPGTNVTTSDTAAGIVINIITKPDNVLELRRRVEHMAAMHTGSSANQGMMQSQMLPGTVTNEPIEYGVRLTLTPRDPEKLARFRDQVGAHVAQMKKGECSMLQGMMGNMMNDPKAEPSTEPPKDKTDHSAHHPEGRP